MQHLESVLRRRLIILIVADEPAASVGGKHLRRFEVRLRKARFARARGSDEDD